MKGKTLLALLGMAIVLMSVIPAHAHPICSCALCVGYEDSRNCVFPRWPSAPVDCGTAVDVLGCPTVASTTAACMAEPQEVQLEAVEPANRSLDGAPVP